MMKAYAFMLNSLKYLLKLNLRLKKIIYGQVKEKRQVK